MDMSKKFLSAAGIIALGLAASSAQANSEKAASGDKEKCYGVVKAGSNDCGAKDNSHSCAGQAKKDSGASEWIYLPKGTCERLSGGKVG